MDHEDEVQIKNKLDRLFKYNNQLTDESNKQVLINRELSNQIQNITSHIRNQQHSIESYLNSFNKELIGRVMTLEEEVQLIQYMYQINHDMVLLRSHVDDIEQILFSSKLGILTRNILGKEELELLTSTDSFKEIKMAVTTYQDQIIIVLLIPQFADHNYSKVLIEPLPDSQNKSILLKNKEILVNDKNIAFEFPVKDNLKKNLVEIDDNCVKNIMNSKEAYCTRIITNIEEVKEITTGVIITKNIRETIINQNCNNLNMKLSGTYLIKFKNCKVEISNKTFENFEKTIYDKIILPNFVTKIKEGKTIPDIKLDELYLKNVKNRELIEIHSKNNRIFNIVSSSINVLAIVSIVTTIIVIILLKRSRKIAVKGTIFKVSSEPQSNDGGVTINKSII